MTDVLTMVGALVVSAAVGWPLTAAVLQLATRPTPARSEEVVEPGTATPPPVDSLRGGTWIGVLERLAVTACLAAGYPAGIAFVIAVKGLGRYPELRAHPDVSERFVIGTLGSMLWAAAVGGVARLLISG